MDISVKIDREAFLLLDLLRMKLNLKSGSGKYLSKKELLSMIVKHYAKRLHEKSDGTGEATDSVPHKKENEVI
ncbi:hypothetical protein D770_05195 [Flammeovirgaceae bacterium 311]|nr:hypothetical protein D770_05195 [Flammeovirgaceae bacterium 311]